MELVVYSEGYNDSDTISFFKELYYSLHMTHLASDLLDKGLSTNQITEAVTIAMKIANSSGLDAVQHFMPVYSGQGHYIIQDCKLSHLAYGLVLMNAEANLPIVGEFQVDLLRRYLDNYY
jgi:hypothetical protein